MLEIVLLYSILRHPFQKLSQWYRHKFKHPESKEIASSSPPNPFMSVLAESINRAPRRLTPLHRYFKLHYVRKIKPEFIRRYAVAKQNWVDATDDEKKRGVVQKPFAVKIHAELGREFWLLETEEFREEIAASAASAHAEEITEWQAAKMLPTTPQEFHQ